MKKILKRSALEHAKALAMGEYSAYELTEAFLKQIDACDGVIGAYLNVDAEGAKQAAKESDVRRKEGKTLGVLDGIPFSLKDNISVKGMLLTCGSKMLEHYVSPYDATVTERLRAAGAVLLGKNNMDEFAMGSSTAYSALGVTRNPHDPSCVPGGSSGGSAAAVAAGEAVFSLGTDTGGSVRQPAAFCGVWGMKPTYGLLSRYGVAAMATSLDCVGVMSRSAEDSAAILSVLVGKDARDATSQEPDVKYEFKKMQAPIAGMRIAVVSAFDEDHTDKDVWHALQRATVGFGKMGAVIETVELPLPEQALASYAVLSCTEASSNLARYDGVHYGSRNGHFQSLDELYANSRGEGFGMEVKRRILFGTDMLLSGNRERYYLRAQRVRELIRREMLKLLSQYDLILTPTAPTVAFGSAERPSPEQLYYADLCTVYASLAGVPALSVPLGRNTKGLPLAVQLTARPFAEGLLLAAAKRLLEVTGDEML